MASAAGYTIAAVFWILIVTFRSTVSIWAADELATSHRVEQMLGSCERYLRKVVSDHRRRSVQIPSREGPNDRRPLSIPRIRDRVLWATADGVRGCPLSQITAACPVFIASSNSAFPA